MLLASLLFVSCSCTFVLAREDIPEIARISHGVFTNVTIPSGISSILFTTLPAGSKFAILQLHTPFNPVTVSTFVSFDSKGTQSSSHCGVISIFSEYVENVTLFIYSSYNSPVQGWARTDAYNFQYPLPGGCGRHVVDGSASAALSYEIMQVPDRTSNSSYQSLRYWTSVVSFTAAGMPDASSEKYKCPTDKQNTSIVYKIYSAPLVTAGGSHNSYVNPDPVEAASVLEALSSTQESLGTLIHSFSITPSALVLSPDVKIPVARRPGTASVLTLVVEYRSASTSARVAYAPTILYGCLNQVPPKHAFGYSFVVQNQSTQLGCGILPTNAPSIYFPVAMLLLGSIFYACSCNFLVWLRCGASVMVTASLLGVIFFYRYSLLTSNAVLVLVVSIFVPGLLALIVFTVLWCLCIRPTLYYQQVFGRGPLMRVLRSDEQPHGYTEIREPWHTGFLAAKPPQPGGGSSSTTGFASGSASSFVVTNDLATAPSFNPLPPVTEEQFSNPGPFDASGTPPQLPSEHLTFEVTDDDDLDDESDERVQLRQQVETYAVEDEEGTYELLNSTVSRCCGHGFSAWTRNRYCCQTNSSARSTRLLSLKPRRIARLPPVLPATFLLVAWLAIVCDTLFSLKASATSYLCFVILISLLLIGASCVFKNLAFGLSTAFVGVYLCLSCICLFLVPNAVLPHIIIEQFLRLTWIEYRLDAIRIEFYGLYDILLLVTWIIGTVIFGLLTLCLIRLQDARELAEAQRARPFSVLPRSEGRSNTALPGAGGSAFWTEVATLSNASWLLPGRGGTPAATGVPVTAPYDTVPTPPINSLSQISAEVAETQGSGWPDSTGASQRAPTERTQLLPGFPRVSYGGLASTTQQPLMPLSRVQLASGNTGRLPSTSLRLFNAPLMSQQTRAMTHVEQEENKGTAEFPGSCS